MDCVAFDQSLMFLFWCVCDLCHQKVFISLIMSKRNVVMFFMFCWVFFSLLLFASFSICWLVESAIFVLVLANFPLAIVLSEMKYEFFFLPPRWQKTKEMRVIFCVSIFFPRWYSCLLSEYIERSISSDKFIYFSDDVWRRNKKEKK